MVETLPLLLDKRKSFFTGRVGDAWDFRHANKKFNRDNRRLSIQT